MEAQFHGSEAWAQAVVLEAYGDYFTVQDEATGTSEFGVPCERLRWPAACGEPEQRF